MLQVNFRDELNLSTSQVLSQSCQLDQKFKVTKQHLINIVSLAQNRNFSEELDEMPKGPAYLEDGLNTDFERGLKGDDIEERSQAFGNNHKPIIPPKTYLELLKDALKDFIMRILIVASLVSIVIEVATNEDHRNTAWIEGFAILVAVVVCCNVTAINDYQKERQFQSLNQVADSRKTVTVWRDNNKVDLHQSYVMVGDVIQIFEGMEIPADCLVLEAAELSTDESAMTGETDPVKKDIYYNCCKIRDKIRDEGAQNQSGRHDVPSPILLSGTRVLSGEGKMLVLVVGDSSCVGKISALLRGGGDDATPLQHKLEEIATDIGKFGLISAILIVFILLLRFAIERIIKQSFESNDVGIMLSFFIIGVTVIVVAIPEGLPLAVTLSLAYSTKRMLHDNNLVRKMAACETMGGADMICSDKTGTLTQNKMNLVCIWNDETIFVDLYSSKVNLEQYIPKNLHELFLQSTIVNGTAMIRPEEKGSKTEIAMINFTERCGTKYEDLRQKYPASLKIPFSSKRKRMSMIVGNNLVTKGASEIIVQACSRFHSKSQGVIQIDSYLREKIETAINQMASQSLRTIGIACKAIQPYDNITQKNEKGIYDIETSALTLIGIIGIKDILRVEVPDAVKKCKNAGIKVRMVTGDNKVTAKAIAIECGILIDELTSLVLEGPEFIDLIGGVVCKQCQTFECDCPRDQYTANLLKKSIRVDTIKNQSAFDEIYPRLDVLARSRPEDKYALVTGLIERGHVVAVTGDGTNDAPALKKADVGFAMGIAGTEVARESAAIILLDDNFNSIVKAVMWGRNIYDSIKKFLQFQLNVNLVAVSLTFVGALFIQQQVLEPIQMLWINLIMDTFASLALATEIPTEQLLERKPHNRNEYIISPKMFKHILGQSFYQFLIIIIIVFAGETFIPEIKNDQDNSYPNLLQYKYSNVGKVNNQYFCDFDQYCTLIASGRMYYLNGDQDYVKFFKDKLIPSRQFTFIFNTFVMMQLFNFVNSRRIQDELNIFEGIFTNYLFPTIVIGILVAQIIIVTFGNVVFSCYSYYGLTFIQWLICIAFGSGSLLIRIIMRQFPDINLPFGIGDHKLVNKHIEKPNPTVNYQIQVINNPEAEHFHQANLSIQDSQA